MGRVTLLDRVTWQLVQGRKKQNKNHCPVACSSCEYEMLEKYSTNCCCLTHRIKLQPTQGTEEQEQWGRVGVLEDKSLRQHHVYRHVGIRYWNIYTCFNERWEGRNKEASKVKETNKQHSTPKAVTFPKKNELPRVGLESTPLYTLDRAVYHWATKAACIYILALFPGLRLYYTKCRSKKNIEKRLTYGGRPGNEATYMYMLNINNHCRIQ